MKRFLWLLLVVVVVVLLVAISYRVLRDHYVRFPTWELDTRFELISVDQNFVVINKPLSMTNDMFFPIQFYLAAFQVIDSQNNLIALMNVNKPIRLAKKSISDVPVRIAVPLAVMDQITSSDDVSMRLYMEGTIQGSVFKIPFTKTISTFITISTEDDLINAVLLPLVIEVNERRNSSALRD